MSEASEVKKSRKSLILTCLAILAAVLLVASTFTTIFVVQPIGAMPDGRTFVIARLNTMKFIDSADAMCAREQGGVTLLCRSLAIGAVLDRTTVYFTLPYIGVLYSWSTGGRQYN